MTTIIRFLFLFTSIFIYAEEDCLKTNFSKDQTTVLNKQENYFQTSTPPKIGFNVNPITGDLIEEEQDLLVAGCEPLSLHRFYNHLGIYEPRTGG